MEAFRSRSQEPSQTLVVRGTGKPISEEELKRLTEDRAKLGPFFDALGISYLAFDMYDDGYTKRFDLNVDRLPWRLRGRFDLVMNWGTSEHVANQFHVFEIAHDALKVGGMMINGVPFFGHVDHGLVNYHPKFFTTLIANNSYEPLFFSFSEIYKTNGDDVYRSVDKAHQGAIWEGHYSGCAQIFVGWRKVNRTPYRPPTDFVLKGDVSTGFPSVNDTVGFIR